MSRLSAIIATLCVSIAFAAPLQAKEVFKARLSGAREVPPVQTPTSGRAWLQVDRKETKVAIRLRVKRGKDIVAAHVHCAPEGMEGPVVVFLAGPVPTGLDVNGGWIDKASFDEGDIVDPACGATIADLADAIRDGDAYVNVHSVGNPGGVIRGQLK
ncbi:CHRD domain-containing protein [Microbaculum marinum]|uniref:CHRD domain-containing protein n=1 Tax=Microbaculum marinum TaxID=1764581 RepID=A0AAW9RLV8_9HYPH